MDISDIDIDSVQADWNMNHFAGVRTTYVSYVEDLSHGYIKFNGYFLYEPEIMPIERILSISYKKNGENSKRVDEDYHIRIVMVKKETIPFRCGACEKGEECDKDDSHIQFFPDQDIQMRFEVITKITSREQMMEVIQKIKGDEIEIIAREEANMLRRSEGEIRKINKRREAYKKENGKSV